jgi:hypothetical protein
VTRPASREERITLWAVVRRYENGSEQLAAVRNSKFDATQLQTSFQGLTAQKRCYVLRPITAVLKLSKPRARKGSK